jgi:Predicted metal-dependent hydrolase
MKYIVDNQEYEVIIDKKRNKNSYIRIKDDLSIYVTTSYFSTKKDVKDMLDRNYDSLQKMLSKKRTNLEKQELFFYLGESYDIIEVSIMDDIEIDSGHIYTKNITMLKKWYQKEIERVFMERYKYNFDCFIEATVMPKLKIRKMKSRWGVYNKQSHAVTLNSHLIEYTIDKLDYVIIHELSHIIHFDHSKEFWNLVKKYCPEYKKMRKDLKE